MHEHFSCLDLVTVKWTSEAGQQMCECATLLEIWSHGGLLHTDRPISPGATVTIALKSAQIDAEVQRYEQDEFGYYVELNVVLQWFPELYQPSYLADTPLAK